MDDSDKQIRYTVEHTEIVRPPKQRLATFGTTNIYYYLLSEPAYSELVKGNPETVIREGRVITERPKIVTPYYLSRLEGFSPDAKRYFEMLFNTQGPSAPGLFYTYKNEPKGLNIASDDLAAVVDKLNADIDRRGDPLTSIVKGEDSLWDVSLMKFIFEITRGSVRNNLTQLDSRGLLDIDAHGVPRDAKLRIEELFKLVAGGESEARDLKEELDRWNLFGEYEDRFLNIFK